MHTTIDYSKSPCKAFDALQDIKEWLGAAKYDELAVHMKGIHNPDNFTLCCSLAGIQGYPVHAWYDHFHGQGAWDKALKADF